MVISIFIWAHPILQTFEPTLFDSKSREAAPLKGIYSAANLIYFHELFLSNFQQTKLPTYNKVSFYSMNVGVELPKKKKNR